MDLRHTKILGDFFKVGFFRMLARGLIGLRGLLIILSLAPESLGEYTAWFLLVFYFTLLDFGTLNGLERDIPHYRGEGNRQKEEESRDVGWSTFFSLTFLASVFLGIVSFIIFKNVILSFLLSINYISDKTYRACEVNSRLQSKFQENGIAQFMLGAISLGLVWLMLPPLGAISIFAAITIAQIISSIFLCFQAPFVFAWKMDGAKIRVFILGALPIALTVYSSELFHNVALTVLGVHFSKQTLGYYSFAFRIFQIFLALFPMSIREVMRTRLFYYAASTQPSSEDSKGLVKMVKVYSWMTLIFILILYWWADAIIYTVAPAYQSSAATLKILSFALLPLGLTIIMGDYLCSSVFKKEGLVIAAWILGIVVQAALMYGINAQNILWQASIVYVSVSLAVFSVVVGYAFKRNQSWDICLGRLLYAMLPWFGLILIFNGMIIVLHWKPSIEFMTNLWPFIVSAILLGGIIGLNNLFAKKIRFDDIFLR